MKPLKPETVMSAKAWDAVCRRYCRGVLDCLELLDGSGGVSSPMLDDMPHGSGTSDPVFDEVVLRMFAATKVSAVNEALEGIDPLYLPWVISYIDCPCPFSTMARRGFPEDLDFSRVLSFSRLVYKRLRGRIPSEFLDLD